MSNQSPFNKLNLSSYNGPSQLYFNVRNAKLIGTQTAAFSLPAGYTCPGACDCLAWFDRKEGKLKDGPNAKFRCFAASLETARKTVRVSVDRNLAILQRAGTTEKMADAIDMSLPSLFFKNIRVHADGDFYNQNYFLAWMEVARRNKKRLFYAYTKSLPIWIKARAAKLIPKNFVLTASRGGKWDELIAPNKLRSSLVVSHTSEAERLGLEIDHDDSLARDPHAGDFALLLHGMQKANSPASEALKVMRKQGIKFSYSAK